MSGDRYGVYLVVDGLCAWILFRIFGGGDYRSQRCEEKEIGMNRRKFLGLSVLIPATIVANKVTEIKPLEDSREGIAPDGGPSSTYYNRLRARQSSDIDHDKDEMHLD